MKTAILITTPNSFLFLNYNTGEPIEMEEEMLKELWAEAKARSEDIVPFHEGANTTWVKITPFKGELIECPHCDRLVPVEIAEFTETEVDQPGWVVWKPIQKKCGCSATLPVCMEWDKYHSICLDRYYLYEETPADRALRDPWDGSDEGDSGGPF